MFNCKPISLSATLIGAAASMTLATAPVEASQISVQSGSISFSGLGTVNDNGTSKTLVFDDLQEESHPFFVSTTGGFDAFITSSPSGNNDYIRDLDITANGGNIGGFATYDYESSSDPWIYLDNVTHSSGVSGSLSFELTGGSNLMEFISNSQFGTSAVYMANPIVGELIFTSTHSNEQSFMGNMSLNYTFNPNNATFNITLSTFSSSNSQTVPEPLTILGSVAAIAFGAGFKRKISRTQK
ncbi:MAG TPA: hypothetical protein DCF68_05290 [Cyanothece sp. UBA12306]|nr:hypothetical protein [Cyanothece sp. UBA12306]